ncbi:ArsR/SmtB family transcription factor [Paenibacillus marinisediminis]
MADLYRGISDPIRRRILQMLAQGERNQSELVQSFTISQPAIKKHLAILLEEDLILERKDGKYRWYRLNGPVMQQCYRQLQQDLGFMMELKLTQFKHYVEENTNDE